MDKRQEYTDRIVNSPNSRKLIVAGAGTGKSYTFKKILEEHFINKSHNLVLTFINNLVDDLSRDLGDFAEVKTFHAYCRRILHSLPNIQGLSSKFEYYPKLRELIIIDALCIQFFGERTKEEIEQQFEKAILNINEDEYLAYYFERANYYNAVSYSDSIYRVLKEFKNNESIIPSLNFVIVDEFQDFNKLEVELLSFLSKRSKNILIAGDDDQSVYGFRESSPCYIRSKYNDNMFSTFELPYCSRCTNIIIKTVNNIISRGFNEGILSNRIAKNYLYHETSKANDSQKYPKIKKINITINKQNCPLIAKYILEVLDGLENEEKFKAIRNSYPLGLVIGPKHYLNQIHKSLSELIDDHRYEVTNLLKNKDSSIPILDGLAHLYKNEESNLGWRIIIENDDTKLDKKVLINNSKNNKLSDLLPEEFKMKWLEVINKLRKQVDSDDEVESEDLIELLGHEYLKDFVQILNRDEIVIKNLKNEVCEVTNSIPEIQLTTRVGSKGLSGDQVFIVGFEEGVYPEQTTPTFSDVCELIVSITRTRKQCHLIHVDKIFDFKTWKKASVFLEWIPTDNCESVKIDANHFKK